eukprot:6940558-Prymnesium_polylepis.1
MNRANGRASSVHGTQIITQSRAPAGGHLRAPGRGGSRCNVRSGPTQVYSGGVTPADRRPGRGTRSASLSC